MVAGTRATASACSSRKSRVKPTDVTRDNDDNDDVIELDDANTKAKRGPNVNWHKNPKWTDMLVDYLSTHPDFRIKLFSDSTKGAKKGLREKLVAKDGRTQQYTTLACHIFESDKGEKAQYAQNPGKYASSVDTRMRRLKAEYQIHLKTLGATGAGLNPKMITENSHLANIIAGIQIDWPWWDDLHAFWRELPNYNPIGVSSSQPGTNHAVEAANLFIAPQPAAEDDQEERELDMTLDNMGENDGVEFTPEELDEMRADADADADGGPFDIEWSLSPPPQDRQTRKFEVETPDNPRSRSITPPPLTQPNFKNLLRFPSSSSAKSSSSRSTPSSTSSKSTTVGGRDAGSAKTASNRNLKTPSKGTKKTVIDRFNDNRENETDRLHNKRKMQHTEEMGRIANKKLKLELKLLQAKNEAIALARATPLEHGHQEFNMPGVPTAPTAAFHQSEPSQSYIDASSSFAIPDYSLGADSVNSSMSVGASELHLFDNLFPSTG